METEKYYFRVGAFFLAVAVVFVAALMIFNTGPESSDTVRYAIYFDNSIAGLTRGAPVKMKGIAVGTVEDIRFVTKDSDRIIILVDIDENAPVHADTAASIAFQGITGATYLSLENTRPDAPPVYLKKEEGQDYPVISSEKSGLQTALANAPELMGSLTKTAAQAQKLLSDKNIAAFQVLLDDTHNTLNEATGALREFKMLARTLRDDPSIILRGNTHEGYKVQK